MNVTVSPSKLSGSIPAIPSKSAAHRALICAALGDGVCELALEHTSDDIDATLRCLGRMGAKFSPAPCGIRAEPITSPALEPELDCGESGSTLRFLLPVAAAVCGAALFTGSGRLPERPTGELINALREHGCAVMGDFVPIRLSGRLRGGRFTLPGGVSSQYITGLLLALPLTEEGGQIRLSTPLQSAGYVGMTVSAMEEFGVSVSVTPDGWAVDGGQRYVSPQRLSVEGDWSNAAFFMAAGALGNGVTVTGLNPNSHQGDKQIADLLERFGARVQWRGNGICVMPGELCGIDIDVGQIPDLLPVLAVIAANASGQTTLYNAARLRLKESDRLKSTAALLRSLGGFAEEREDALVVRGTGLTGGVADGFCDHRIVMAGAVAASLAAGDVTIMGAEAVKKSYPSFFEDFKKTGGLLKCRPALEID